MAWVEYEQPDMTWYDERERRYRDFFIEFSKPTPEHLANYDLFKRGERERLVQFLTRPVIKRKPCGCAQSTPCMCDQFKTATE